MENIIKMIGGLIVGCFKGFGSAVKTAKAESELIEAIASVPLKKMDIQCPVCENDFDIKVDEPRPDLHQIICETCGLCLQGSGVVDIDQAKEIAIKKSLQKRD